MFFLASKIKKVPVVSFSTGRFLGRVLDFIHDEETGKIIAFLVKKGGFFSPSKIISITDIVNFSFFVIIVSKDEALMNLEEVIRAKESFSKKIKILNNKVVDEKNHFLGWAFDFLFSYPLFSLEKIYVKPPHFKALFSKNFIIPANQILKITPQKIIVRGDFLSLSKAKEKEFVLPAGN